MTEPDKPEDPGFSEYIEAARHSRIPHESLPAYDPKMTYSGQRGWFAYSRKGERSGDT